jgi:17beta-estradiol 17-dehydrogenase / very-long-chain 3-oxoacyl-CoA reductase
MNIYLISRTEAKLSAAAAELQSQYNVQAEYFVADLVASGSFADAGAAWFGLQSNLESLDVGVLINNAGMSYDCPEYFHHLDTKQIQDMLAINAAALTQMIRVVLPGMKERGRGCIVNITSGVSAALPACPLLAVYAATKAYVNSLTAALAAEYDHFGIRFQACPTAAWLNVRGLPLSCYEIQRDNQFLMSQTLTWC